jgi:hypothetical protein
LFRRPGFKAGNRIDLFRRMIFDGVSGPRTPAAAM